MSAAAPSAGTTWTRALDPHGGPAPYHSVEASSSSSSTPLGPAAMACNSSDKEEQEGVLDTPWLAVAEAESRLEEAMNDLAKAEQEDYEMQDNWQRQDDELMALEAIYGDDLAVFENEGGLRYFQVYIRYDLPGGVDVGAKLSSANASPRDVGCCDGPDEFSYTCNLEYLPPLILTCLLPRSYPSRDPPCFVVTAKWMDESCVSQLCQMLDMICAQLPGQEIIYHWVEWLRNSSLSCIWSDGRIMLGPDTATRNGDNRAISRTLSLESVIPLMLSYSSKKQCQAFLDDLHMCMICFNQSIGSNFARLPCQHLFCLKCMGTLCRMHVKEGSVFQLVCPDTKCNASIPPYVLKRLLTEEEFERWDRLVLQKSLDSMSDVVYCPKCVIGCLEDEENIAQCPECTFIFCSFCKGPSHPGKQCLTPEQKIQRRQGSGRMSEKEMAKELLNIRELYKDVRLCPKCRMAITKTEGCNKMVCGSCGQYFCFQCGMAITGYEHFRDAVNCKLFAASDIAEWERQMEAIGHRMRISLRPIGGNVRCPKCRAINFKEDERYIFCWSCRANYCMLCRRTVESKKKSKHHGSLECMGRK